MFNYLTANGYYVFAYDATANDESEGEVVGGVAKLLLPFASIHEYFMYGNYSFSTGMKGFANSDCAVMVVHGVQDDTISIKYGYDKYYKNMETIPASPSKSTRIATTRLHGLRKAPQTSNCLRKSSASLIPLFKNNIAKNHA